MYIEKLSNSTLYIVIKNSKTKVQTLFLIYIKSTPRIVTQDIVILAVNLLYRMFQSGK